MFLKLFMGGLMRQNFLNRLVDDAPADELGLEEYADVISAETIDEKSPTAAHATLNDARNEDGKVLSVLLKPSGGEDDGRRKNRVLKLSISPEGNAVLEMGRGLVIV